MKIYTPFIMSAILLLTHISLAQDVPSSKDHPLITRYPGSAITYYNEKQFDEYTIPLGPVEPANGGNMFPQKLSVSGKVTRIHYLTEGKASSIEIFQNYKDALAKAKFETLIDGGGDNGSNAIAGANWTNTAYKNLDPAAKGPLGNFGHLDQRRYLAAKAARAEGDVYVTVMAVQRADDEVHVQLDVIEAQPVKSGLISVDASFLKSELEQTGHVAIYGIYFDTDKSDVKAESQSVLAVIAQLMKENSDLNLYVVGHTDMTGSYEHNQKLSDDRAKSVVKELTGKHSVAAARLSGYGVGPLCPVATNATEDGRAKNRRVELVRK